jgi:uncharacterized protein YbjT (DUF2867 family)
MREQKVFAVFGATGAQGGPVLRRLVAAGHRVRAIGRTPERLRPLEGDRVEAVDLDLADEAATTRALAGVDGAFVQLPFVPVHAVIEAQARSVARALVAGRVPLAVFTTSGPVPAAPTGVATFDVKALAERTLRASGAPLVVLRPFTYLGNLSAPFGAPGVVHDGELRYPLPAHHRQPWISVEDQAALAVAALGRPDLAGRVYPVGEPLTGPELAARIGRGLGRPVRYVPLPPELFGQTIAQVMGEAVGRAIADDYRLVAARPPGLGLDADTGQAWRELGVSPTPVEAWAQSQPWEAAAAQWSAGLEARAGSKVPEGVRATPPR